MITFDGHALEDAMLEAALMNDLEDAVATTGFDEVCRAHSCGRFADAIAAARLAEQLPSMRLTILAPEDAALETLPFLDTAALREWCAAHICSGDCTGEALHSMQGTIHRAEYPDGRLGAPAHEAVRIGAATVSAALPFSHGCILRLDAPLHALHLETACRPEQVWQKAVVPPPAITVVGASSTTTELHVQLVHVPTNTTLPESALRGGLKRVGTEPTVRFTDLAIEHKPSSCARKRAAGADEQRKQENSYTLAFTLVCPLAGRILCATRQLSHLTLRNSFHTLSEAEKEYRRQVNRPGGASHSPPSPPSLLPPTIRPPTATNDLGRLLAIDSSLSSTPRAASLLDIMPPVGPAEGGNEVWLHGEGLADAKLTVYFGGVPAKRVTLCSPNLIKCIAPPRHDMNGAAEQAVRVTVGSADSEDGVTFTYRGLGSVAKHLARALETGDAPSILMLARELSLPELEQKAMRVVGEV